MVKNTNKNLKKFSVLSWLLPIIVCLLVIGFLVQSYFTFYLFRQSQVQGNAHIGRLIVEAAENLNKPVTKDPKTGAVLVSEAKLTLPSVPTKLGTIVYSYEGVSEDSGPLLRLASQNDINSAKSPVLAANTSVEKTFEAVPKLQACARGVLITFNQKDVQQEAGTKVLSNGKTVYFSIEPLCSNEDLVQYTKEIDSYN